MTNWSKIWRIAAIVAIVLAAVIYCILYFKYNNVWAGVSTIAAFVVGAIAGYLVRGLKALKKEEK